MFIDGGSQAGSTRTADVCIVGAGPAGITVASELMDAGLRVIVLESGSRYHDRHDSSTLAASVRGHVNGAQSATRGLNRGAPYFPLRMSRVRGIGGSTAALLEHGLRSRPLDPIDVESPGSSPWPIAPEEIGSRIAGASEYCGIADQDEWWKGGVGGGIFRGDAGVADIAFRHGGRDRFALLAERIAVADDQSWITDATATHFAVDDGGAITHVDVRTAKGDVFTVQADTFVLATGGIDNARLLLNNEQILGVMGDAADNVGRHFMEHMHYVAGHIVPRNDAARSVIAQRYCDIGEEIWIAPTDSEVRREGMARSAFLPVEAYLSSLAPGVNALGRLTRSVPFGPFDSKLWRTEMRTIWRDRSDIPSLFTDRIRDSVSRDCFAVSAMSEQTPNRNSVVSLSDNRDRYGLRLPVLHWDIASKDWRDARRSTELLGDALDGSDLGDFVPAWTEDATGPTAFTGGWHHMGTTRMSAEPRDGVVDVNARVFGTSNLYVAGSSVFPTGGVANPTLTLVALSMRLAGHLTRA